MAKPGVAAAVARFSRSIRVQLTVLTVIFLSIPILLYSVFRDADLDKQRLLLDTVRESGMLVARALTPLLEALPQGELGRVPRELARFQSEQHSLTLFYKPKAASSAAGFFYVASAPPVPAERLEGERARLLELGILQRLAASCTGNVPLSERIASPEETTEIVTSVTPVQSGNGCWAVVIATEARAAASIVDGRPYWARPEVRLALTIYGAMALLVVVVVGAVWRSLTRFRRTAAAVPAAMTRPGVALALFMLGVPIGLALSSFCSGPLAQAFGWRVAMVVAAVPAHTWICTAYRCSRNRLHARPHAQLGLSSHSQAIGVVLSRQRRPLQNAC